jgi:hypothetical protein
MKKTLSLVLVLTFFVSLLTFNSCKKTDSSADVNPEMIVGRWCTSDEGHYEVYYSDGSGKMWDPADDVTEDEATEFTWEIDDNKKLTQYIQFEGGQAVIPQYCNILILNETTFKYNNDGWRAEYTLTRVE